MLTFFSCSKRTIGMAFVALVLLGTSALFLYHLGSEPLQDYDEATYAEVVHEAFINHNFLSFTYADTPYFKKPPLLFWLIGFSEEIVQNVETGVRLPSALAGIALVGVIMLFVYEVSSNWYGAAFAGAALATTSPFMETARQSRFDILVALCIVLAGYCFFRADTNPRWFLGFGFMAGLAVLSKSVIAVFAGVFAIFIALFLWRFDWLTNKYFWGGVGIFLLIAAPWHLYETLLFGGAFWQSYIGTEVIARTQENLFWTVTITNRDYVDYLFQFTTPWIWVFFASVASAPLWWKRLGKKECAVVLACIGTIALMIIVFFSAATKAPTYLIQLYPFAALVIGIAASSLFSIRYVNSAAALAALLLLAYAAPYSVYNAYHLNPYYSSEIQLAQEEKTVGQLLAERGGGEPLYSYAEENLGSIMFYSQNLHPLVLVASSTPPRGSFLVVGSDATSTLAKNFPKIGTQTLYAGTQVTLLRIAMLK